MDMPLQLRDAITNLASGYKQAQLKNAAQASLIVIKMKVDRDEDLLLKILKQLLMLLLECQPHLAQLVLP